MFQIAERSFLIGGSSSFLCVDAMSACFFIAGFDDAKHRRRVYIDGDDGGFERKRLPLNVPPWMQSKLNACSRDFPLNCFDGKVGLLVTVKPGTAYDGPLTIWTDEESLIWEFGAKALNAYSLKIDTVILLDLFEPHSLRGKDHFSTNLYTLPGMQCSMDTLTGRVVASSTWPIGFRVDPDNVRDVLGLVDNKSWEDMSQSRPCLFQLDSVCRLLAAGKWQSIMRFTDMYLSVTKRAQRLQQKRQNADECFFRSLSWPSAEWKRVAAARMLHPPTKLCFECNHARDLAAAMRRWAPAILAQESEDQIDETKGFIEEMLLRLDTVSAPAHSKYDDCDPVFPAMFAASRCKDRKRVKEVVSYAAQVVWPKHVGESVNEALHSMRVLRADVLSREQIFLDATLCCISAEDLGKDDGPLFFWADASPQHGTDWWLSTLMWIPDAVLHDAADAAHALITSVADFQHAWECDDDDEMIRLTQQRDVSSSILSKSVIFHRQIPIALGSGKSGVEYKLKALVQKVFPESQSAGGVSKLFRRIKGVCVDLGEKTLPDVSGLRVEDVAPTHLRPDFYLHDSTALDGVDTSPFVLPDAMLIAGSCHVLNNAVSAVDSSLEGWSWWLPGCKALGHMLHHDHLRRNVFFVFLFETIYIYVELDLPTRSLQLTYICQAGPIYMSNIYVKLDLPMSYICRAGPIYVELDLRMNVCMHVM